MLPRKSLKRAKVCLSSSIVPKKSSQFRIPKSCRRVCQNMAFKWVPNTPSNPLFPTFPMTNPTQKVQKWSTFSCSGVAVLFLGQDFAFFFNEVNNMISTHTKDFCVKKLALICLPDFKEFSLSPYFYNRFQHIAKYERVSLILPLSESGL